MKPAPFSYAAPKSLEEVFDLIELADGNARLLAGGQSLIPMLNLRQLRPAALIDLTRVSELSRLRREGGDLHLGAMVRHSEVESSSFVAKTHSILGRAASEIGHAAIRNRGTIGGSLALGDPAGEFPLVAAILGASITLRSRTRTRAVSAADFYFGAFRSVIEPDEILTEVAFPALPPRTTWGFQELCRRPHDFAIAAVGATITFDSHGRISRAAIGLGGVDETVILAADAAASLIGTEGTKTSIAVAAQAASLECKPVSDVRASADYRRQITRVLTARVLQEAVEKSKAS